MVLNIIFNLFNKKFIFFQNLAFNKISIALDDNTLIQIVKRIENKKNLVKFSFHYNKKEIESFDYSNNMDAELERAISNYFPAHRISNNQWFDHRSDKVLTLDELLSEYPNMLPEHLSKNLSRVKSERINSTLESIKVHLIREQRLFKKVPNTDRARREEKEQTIMTETIQAYAKELKQLISEYSQRSFIQSQALDSSYPNRLISERGKVSSDEYKERFTKLKEKQEKLAEFGLYESKQKVLDYSEDDAKALLVYLNDLEQKLGVFDILLEKLELFTTILNERRFTFKQINVNRDKGFYFNTTRGVDLELSQLSSGEQHEVVLLYELIFNTTQNILVLIDEPEISLHITWQKEFLNDLLRIIRIQNIQVVIATHSPSIINDRWDLVYNLEAVEV